MMACYIFGPVPSRRLGRSLGVDLVAFKTCSYDCIYCQLAKTTCKTLSRAEWVPLQDVLQQLKAKLAGGADYITLAGSGEPTLYSRIGELIDGIKEMTDIPIAVLTNGSMLSYPEVRKAISRADLVVPSLDAGDAETFERVNRPAEGVSFEQMVEGLVAFRQEHKGQYWLEVFLLAGVNDQAEQVQKMAQIAARINPDRIQLNTVTRPPVEEYALAVPKEQMDRFAKMFGEKAEVIADYQPSKQAAQSIGGAKEILETIARRPCTVEDLAQVLEILPHEIVKHLGKLSAQGLIESQNRSGQVYYMTKRGHLDSLDQDHQSSK